MKVVSRCRISVLMKVISFRVFSNISLGSSEGHRRQFGAQTIAKLFSSIFVITLWLGSEKICKKQTNFLKRWLFQLFKLESKSPTYGAHIETKSTSQLTHHQNLLQFWYDLFTRSKSTLSSWEGYPSPILSDFIGKKGTVRVHWPRPRP